MIKQGISRVILLTLLLGMFACKETAKQTNQLEYSEYVTAFTGGVIRSTDPIFIRLDEGVINLKDSLKTSLQDVIKISPACPGTVSLKEGNTLEFTPDAPFKNGNTYKVSLALGKITTVPKKLGTFTFDVKILPLTYSFLGGELNTNPEDATTFYYTGTIQNSDITRDEEVEKLVSAELDNKSIAITWEHETYSHRFTVQHIERNNGVRCLRLMFDEKVQNGDIEEIAIPAIGDFYVIDVKPLNEEASSLNIILSDKVDPSQNLAGLIEIEGVDKLNFNVQGNTIRTYLPEGNHLQGVANVRIHRGIANTSGDKLQDDKTFQVNFPSSKPQAEFIGKGIFSPAEGNILIPISTVGLRAIQLHVVKIFNNNTHFYLQEANYDYIRNYETRRSGRTILNKKINLVQPGQEIDLSRWQDFTINLGDYIKVEKGVIYQVELRFYKSYSTFADGTTPANGLEEENAIPKDEEAFFDGETYGYSYYPDNYNWQERDNPASDSYYTSDRFPVRNIVVTSLGLTVKGGADGKYIAAVNNLLTAEAVKDCKVVFYNYQHQKLDSAFTDKDGFATVRLKGKPFTAFASKGNDKVYLKINDASSLSYSNFDISGDVTQQGIKGFLYGERGVWRPGDDIYLSFMLEDKENLIPIGHPIIAELYDPNGNIADSRRTGRNEHGLYCFTFKTDQQAVTGYWRAVVRIGGRSFTKTIRVETVKPNRLSIEAKIPGGIMGEGSATEYIPVMTRWLHGAKTSSLKAQTELRLTRGNTTFEGYTGFIFDDLSRAFNPSETTLFDGTTDTEGNFRIPLNTITAENAPGMLNARLTTRVYEPGGDFSISTTGFKYSPYKEYVGIKLAKSENDWYAAGKNIPLQGIVLTADGKKVNNREIKVEVYALEWRWWWDAENENLSNYVNRAYRKPVWTGSFKTVNGSFSTNINLAEWGRYFVIARDEISSHTCGTTLYVSSWDNDMNIPGMASLLNLTTDKKSYRSGETIRVKFPSSEGGIALVSIENGKTVKDIFRVPTRAGSTTFEIAATSEMCPNIYVNISLVQPQKDRDNDKPIRLYGVVNIPVEDPTLQLNPRVTAADEIRPSSDFTVTVKEKDGKPMTYSIAVVDEGLLSLTSFKTPNPFSAFYAREALGVKTWDFYDDVCGSYGGRLESAFAVGGDEAVNMENARETNRFTPVVIFKGPFTLEKGKQKQHTFHMPEYVGEVRVMVVAEDKGRYGSTSRDIKVNKPLMLNVTMPRLFTPGDEIEIPVTVFAMKDNIKDVEVSLKTDDKLEIIGSSRTQVHFNGTGEQIAFLKARVKENIGKSTLTFSARSGNETARYSCEVEIRVPNPRITQVKNLEIPAGKTITLESPVEGLEPLATLEVSSIPALNLEQRLNELIQYPHGCVEQITSTVLPQLALNHLLDLDEGDKVTVETNVKEVISRLRNYQHSNGGFCYWMNSKQVSEWATTYVTDFLVQAERQGYRVPAGMKNGALDYLTRQANTWRQGDRYDELEQSYRLYVLASAGKSNLPAMNRLREMEYTNPVARWQLAGAYALARHEDIARNLVAHLPAEVEKYRQLGRCYGSDLRDNAIILRSLIDMDMREKAYSLIQKMARRFASGEWLSTQECAMGLTAIGQYAGKYLQQDKGIDILVNGKAATTAKTVFQQTIPMKNGKTSVSVKNNGQSTLHAQLISSAIPLGVATDEEMNGLYLSVDYYRNGKPDNSAIYKQGEDIVIEITVHNTGSIGRYDELALTFMFPSGFEYLNERLTSGDTPFKEADNADIRDDRVNLYFSLEQGQWKKFRFRFNAAYPGHYLFPAINCSAMYDNSITATLAGQRIEIKR